MKIKRLIGVALSATILFTSVNTNFIQPTKVIAADAAVVSITEAGGWHESAYVKWTAFEGADSYNVYIKPLSGEYTKLDDMLVREYADYYRADAIGLSAGNYVLKVVPVKSGSELSSAATETATLTVDNFLREGFAFSSQSPVGYTTGAYNQDGTLKSDAEVVYVTDANRNTVTINGDESKGVGISGIIKARNNSKSETPIAIRFIGKVREPQNINLDHTLRIENNQNVTVEGVGDDAVLHGWGFSLKRTKNIEIRNCAIMWQCNGTDGDSISFDTENYNAFIHNMDFFYGAPGAEEDQKKGDGIIDMKHQTDYITISYNHFYDTGKTTFSGGQWELSNRTNPLAKVNVSYHHNWFDYADSRHPRCVVGNTHVYNNYYVGNGYGAAACVDASMFVEKNYYENCGRPMMIGSQGSDSYRGNGVFNGSKNLSNQDGGMIKAFDNYMTGYETYFNQNNTPVAGQIDAYEVTSRDEKVPNTITAVKGGWAYNNFDTEPTFYSYNPDNATDVKAKVIAGAGRINGGDLKWTFTSSDANQGGIISGLQSAVKNYEQKVLKAGGLVVKGEEIVTEPTTETTTQTVIDGGKLNDDYVWDLSKISTVPENNIWCGETFTAGTGKNTYISADGHSYEISGYYSSANSPKTAENLSPKGGSDIPVTGCFVAITPTGNGKITVALRTGANKTSYVSDGTNTLKTIDNVGQATNRFDVITFSVELGKTYYVYTNGSKARYAYIGFTGGTSVDTTSESTTELTTEITTETTTESTTEEVMLYGDADGNKSVNIVDVRMTLTHILTPDKSGISDKILTYLDVSKDGKICSDDVAMILQNVLDSTFNIGNN